MFWGDLGLFGVVWGNSMDRKIQVLFVWPNNADLRCLRVIIN